MSESAKELYSRRGDIILGPTSGTVRDGTYSTTIDGIRIDSVVEAGKSYIIVFNSDDPEWANMSLLANPGSIRTPLKQLNSTTYIVKFTATGAETAIGPYNAGAGKTLSCLNFMLYEYAPEISGNVLRPFVANKMYYRNQEVQKLYLGSRLLWELQQEPAVPEVTFTLFARHSSKPQNIPFITIGKQDFTNFGVDPSTVTAITVNAEWLAGERYDVTRIDESSVSDVYIYIENADSLALNGFETLTVHYRA